jgi:phosphoglycolate phosphatase
MVTQVLFWDIDGTLLTTARAGIFAWEAAAEEVCERKVDLSRLRTAGLTDAEIAVLVVREAGGEPTPERASSILRSYERHLPERLRWRQGSVLPGVVEILEDLAVRPNVASLLLTGNTRRGAQAKLRHYGLERYFPDGGAFCRGVADRIAIAREAWDRAAAANGSGTLQAFVIGDTPHDVRCGQAVGARTVAVASGSHSLAELRDCGAWLALEALPRPERFAELLELD